MELRAGKEISVVQFRISLSTEKYKKLSNIFENIRALFMKFPIHSELFNTSLKDNFSGNWTNNILPSDDYIRNYITLE